MASSINASTSGAGGVITTADNTGTLQLQSGNTTIATISSTGLALNTGNITLPSGAAPAFSAYNAGTQSISSNTATKVIFNAENFDTNNNFDSTTNYRFTPTVAGYYQLNTSLYESGFAGSLIILTLFKNGGTLQELYRSGLSGQSSFNGSSMVFANGTTDYFEISVYSSGSTMTLGANSSLYMNFNGAMIRSA